MGKKIFSTIILVVILVGVGYFFYTEQLQSQAPDVVAEDTGTLSIEEIDKSDYESYDKEFKNLEKKYEYTEVFDTWESLNDDDEADVYHIPKYPNKDLYLVYASKQGDGKIAAVFSDKPIEESKK